MKKIAFILALCILVTAFSVSVIAVESEDMALPTGDVNCDGVVDMFDYIIIKTIHFGRYNPTDEELARADVNGDGKVDMFDYVAVKYECFNNHLPNDDDVIPNDPDWEDPQEIVAFYSRYEMSSINPIPQEKAIYLLRLMENGDWFMGTTDCLPDVGFMINGTEYSYHAECGAINDFTNQRSFAVEIGSRTWYFLNTVFGISEQLPPPADEFSMVIYTKPDRSEAIAIDDHTADKLFAIICAGVWQDECAECVPNYIFEITENCIKKVIEYSAECGTFNWAGQHMVLDEATKELFNTILGYGVEPSNPHTAKAVEALEFPLSGEEFSTDDLRNAIDTYTESCITAKLGINDIATFETDFHVKSVSVPIISHIVEGEKYGELEGYIDLYLPVEFDEGTVIIPIDWWYQDGSWVQNYPIWSYTLRVTDDEDNVHWFYVRIEHCK